MAYPNDNKLNIIIAQTSASADSSGKFPFTERIISGSNLFIVTDVNGFLTGSTSIPASTSSWANNASTASRVIVTDTTTGAGPYYVTFVDGTTGDRAVLTDSSVLTWNATTNTLSSSGVIVSNGITSSNATITSITGALSGSSIQSGNATLTSITGVNTISGANLAITALSVTASNLLALQSIRGLQGITGSLSGSDISTGNVTINGGNINNTVIGGTTPAAGTFTTLTVTTNTNLGDNVSDLVKITGSVNISGSLSVVGSISGTIDSSNTASKILVTNIPSTSGTYYVTFVSNTGSAQTINTDSDLISWDPSLNKLTLGSTVDQFTIGSGSGGIFDIQVNSTNSLVTVGSSGTGSMTIGGSSAFNVNSTLGVNTFNTNATSSFTNALNATSWNNGAVIVTGGVGIGKDLHVSGSTFLYGNLTIYGTGSVVNISSSTIIIGDNRIVLNTGTPIQRYAGIDVYDSGSGTYVNNITSSLLWDGLTDNWLLVNANSSSGTFTTGSSIIIGGPISQFGSETTLTTNTIPKAQSSGKNLQNSLLSDNGTVLSYVGTGISASQITASNVISTNISASLITASNLTVQYTGSITYATGVYITYTTGSFTTITITTGSSPGVGAQVPSSPTATGLAGQINVDNNFIYVYTNQVWKRVPLSTWLS